MHLYPQLKRWSFALGLALVAIGAGCIKTLSDGSDGSSCDSSSDCDSKTCSYGTCAGKSCTSPSDCDHGWACFTPTGSDLGRVLGEDDSPYCRPTCTACPSSMHCPLTGGVPVSANEGSGTTYCAEGPPRTGTIAGPDTVVAGSIVSYSVTFAPAHDFEVYDWTSGPVGDTTETPSTVSQDGGTASLEITATQEGDVQIAVQAQDVNASKDPGAPLPTAEAVRTVHVMCTPQGGNCSAYGSCCQGGQRCDYDVDGGICM